MTDLEVLDRAGLVSIAAMIIKAQIRWMGHVRDSRGQFPHPTSAPLWGTCAETQKPRAAKEALQRLRQGKP